ncbi:MAG: protein kinase [candidate division KSB1 bacterium]|nr:protein kinase [candidate division KSB1 bacterium]MDZ7274927.1 protein kinase [candidate division KSB1 bacterium]MDZ7286621.1 protein kinase [candidate division KSB1 bacterium]MDZ7299216.1 protein kinase [candidate division KSB1 bacterium]MDZ7308349.1 protein kinase [candidate division KSB1 bacterium]
MMTQSHPFVIGQWVRGEKFFGRAALIDELLHGPREAVWIAGLRRMGKTSLLRELERRVLLSVDSVYLPLYWDLEGAVDDDTLRESLLAGLDEARDRFDYDRDWEKLSTPEILRRLQSTTRSHNKRLLLLCDEGEALLALAQNDVPLLARLRRVLQGSETVRCLLTATRRLARLETFEGAETSPFLHGFTPPLYLSPFSEEEARSLTAQADFDAAVQAQLFACTGGHPFLLQVLAKRTLELGEIDAALASMQHDETLRNFFQVDYQSLQPVEQALLQRCARQSLPAETLATTAVERIALQTLRALGLLAETGEMVQLRSPLFQNWLAALPSALVQVESATAAGTIAVTLPLQPGDRIGAYEILYEIGRGGMGVVYCAQDVHLQRRAAIKVLPPELGHEPAQRARLLAEARALSQLSHPNIAIIYAVEFIDGAPCLCMEYVEGLPLDEWASQPNNDFSQKLAVARQIASALAAAHAAGLIHRDLKPSNIIVNSQQVVKLLDFGIARREQAALRLTQAGQMLGTPAYMSPEQISNLEVDRRSDVFSLGVVLYELFTGRRPFQGENLYALAYAIVNENPAAPAASAPAISTELQQVLLQALQKQPAKRFADAGELLSRLLQI